MFCCQWIQLTSPYRLYQTPVQCRIHYLGNVDNVQSAAVMLLLINRFQASLLYLLKLRSNVNEGGLNQRSDAAESKYSEIRVRLRIRSEFLIACLSPRM